MLVPEKESNQAEKQKGNHVPISRPKGLVIVISLFWLAGT
jgi:hypothetical protein